MQVRKRVVQIEKVLLQGNISLVFQHQYHIGAGSAVAGFIDNNIIRHYDGKLVIPASTLKGQLRYNATLILPNLPWKERCSAQPDCRCIICRNLGKGGYAPGRLFFYDLIQASALDNTVVKTEIAINRKTRTAQHEALFRTEVGTSPILNGKYDAFIGSIEGMIPENDAVKIASLLYMAFKMITAIGGGKSRGLGVIDHARSKCEFYIGEKATPLSIEKMQEITGGVVE